MQYSGIAYKAQHNAGAGLFLFDVDGTILERGKRSPSEATLVAMEDARAQGYTLAVSSGRCWGLIPPSLVRRGVMDYFVCSNGACVLDGTGRPLMRRAMSREECWDVLGLLADLGPGWNCFTGPRAYAELRAASYMMASSGGGAGRSALATLRHGLDTARLVLGGVGFRYMPSMEWLLARWPHGLEKVGASFPSEEARDEASRRLAEHGGYEVVSMGSTEIEVTLAGTTKGTGVDWLVSHVGVERENVIAFGDSENDLPLLGHVGRFVGMGNSTPQVLEAADELTGRIDEEGVATWLERFVQERCVR